MEKINTKEELRNAIQQLESQQHKDWSELKVQCVDTYEMLKTATKDQLEKKVPGISHDFKDEILDSTLNLAANFLSRKIIPGSHNPVKQIFRTFIQMGVINLVSKHTGEIKSTAENLVKRFLNRKEKSTIIICGPVENSNSKERLGICDETMVY